MSKSSLFFAISMVLSFTVHNLAPAAPITVDGSVLRDSDGRQVLLHGLNIISKNPKEEYLSWHRESDYARLKQWGMNCVRLGILWDGLEPEPGSYNEDYLDAIETRLDWAAAHGLFVFLDMHQDLFSRLYADGAPEWATLHEGKPHITGAVWSDAYTYSQAVQTAFDNFWANAPAANGVGIQERYARTWRVVAKRFAAHPALLGYDLMNEPFMGSDVVPLTQALIRSEFAGRMLQHLGEAEQPPEKLALIWADDNSRPRIVQALEDPTLYRLFLEAQQDVNRTFERTKLQPMYERVSRAIREVDPKGILFLETSYHCNTGIPSALEAIRDANGQRDTQQVFAPHGYDIVVDTPAYVHSSSARVNTIFENLAATQRRLRMPLLIGEWGAFGTNGPAILPAARMVVKHLERFGASDTYWLYERDLEQRAYFSALRRPLPQRIAGTLVSYKSRPETGAFTCTWKEDPCVSAATLVYLPGRYAKATPTVSPANPPYTIQALENAILLSIPPTGNTITRTLSIAAP